MQGAAEVGSGEGHGEREAETRLVQLIDRDDREKARLGLLPSAGWIGVSPINVTLLGPGAYHSGVDASKAESISAVSAR
jgi:hypothetical protein